MNEKSVINYVLTTPQIARSIHSMIMDEDESLRVKGKKRNRPQHNSYVNKNKRHMAANLQANMENQLHRKMEKFIVEMKNPVNKERIERETYEQAAKTIKNILNSTIGIRKIRTDKTRGTTNESIKAAKKAKKEARYKFNQVSMRAGNNTRQANCKKKGIFGKPNQT